MWIPPKMKIHFKHQKQSVNCVVDQMDQNPNIIHQVLLLELQLVLPDLALGMLCLDCDFYIMFQYFKLKFSSSDEEESNESGGSSDEINSSDLDTDFEADELLLNLKQIIQSSSKRVKQPTAKAAEAQEKKPEVKEAPAEPTKPILKLKIKLPPKPSAPPPEIKPITVPTPVTHRPRMINTSLNHRKRPGAHLTPQYSKKRVKSPKKQSRSIDSSVQHSHNPSLSDKMRESLALNQQHHHDSSSEEEHVEKEDTNATIPFNPTYPTSTASSSVLALPVPMNPMTDNRLYCVCQCPHDDVSEMIGCDAPDCRVEWFHFECVGILVPPEGKWYCPECSKRYKI